MLAILYPRRQPSVRQRKRLHASALGTNGAYRFPRITGPGFFDTDLTAAKALRIKDVTTLQLRLAAFNFNELQPEHGITNVNQALLSSSASANPQFGYAPLREGCRIVEVGMRLTF